MSKIPFRIALRVEGKWWVAYLAPPIGMEGSVEVARCIMNPVLESKKAKKAFMDLAMVLVEVATKATGGSIDSWNKPTPAPESERSGNA